MTRGLNGQTRRGAGPGSWPTLGALLIALALGGPPGCSGALPGALAPRPTGGIHGTLVPPAPDPAGQERAPVVVYLEPMQGAPPAPQRLPMATVHPDPAAYFPAFLVVAAGQELRFPGSPEVYHHVFSYSKPNDFDLGVAEQGDARVVTLHHPGAVRLYCSLHPWETGLIFVSPSPYFDTVDDTGGYEIREVPPGRYRLIAWGEAKSAASRIVTVRPGSSTAVELSAPEPAAPAPGARP